jgi:hypothetical protein
MGTPMTLPDTAAFARAVPVTPLLAFLAGGHAGAIARIWPAPHEAFLALPAARRHAAAILAGRAEYPPAQVEWLAARARDRDLASELFGGEAPGGLMKALARMGEVLWAGDDYARFLRLFGEAEARLIIRHLKALDAGTLARMDALPVPLRQPAILTHLGADDTAIADLAAAWAFALRVRSEAAGPAIAQRFGRATSRAGLFEMARQEIQPQDFGAVRPPPELPAPFHPVRRYDTLSKTAHDFRNCLRDFVADLASGRMAVYVWRGEGGPAAVALRQDPGGWRLAEARGRDNIELADAPLMEIVAAVKAAGIRTGESWGWLNRRLEDRAFEGPPHPAPAAVQDWRAALGLGNIWD